MDKEYKEVNNFILIKIGKLENDLVITEKMIEKSIDKNVFNHAPIITSNGSHKRAIGFVLPDTTRIDGNNVVANVALWEGFEDKDCYDEWNILLDDNRKPTYIKNYFCELHEDKAVK